MKRYFVATNDTDLRIRADPTFDGRIIGGVDRDVDVYVDDSVAQRGPWKKLGKPAGWIPPPRWRPGWVHERFLREDTAAPQGPSALARHLLVFIGGHLGPFTAREIRRGAHGPPATLPERGWAMIEGGDITRVDPRPPGNLPRSCFKAFLRLAEAFPAPSKAFAINPALDNGHENGAVRRGMTLVAEHADPAGKLVLYGFSAGGFNALRLAERLARDQPQRAVDLLVTVDACLQRLPGSTDFRVETPTSVRKHVNHYQTTDEFKGRSMPRLGGDDRHWPGRPDAHDSMPTVTLPAVRTTINDVLAASTPAATNATAVP